MSKQNTVRWWMLVQASNITNCLRQNDKAKLAAHRDSAAARVNPPYLPLVDQTYCVVLKPEIFHPLFPTQNPSSRRISPLFEFAMNILFIPFVNH